MGDVLKIHKDESFPTDLLLLYALNDHHQPVDILFIDTMNLDGETNLKPRNVVDKTIDTDTKLMNLSAKLVYDGPSEDLDNWDG